jgi:hypothetical protein
MNLAGDAARARGAKNQISGLDYNLSDNHGVEITCVSDSVHLDKHIDVKTVITTNVQTAFVHLVFPGVVKNTVTSVVRIYPRTDFAFGQTIVSLSEDCGTNDGGIEMKGGGGASVNIRINGGGIFSNSCLTGTGNFAAIVTGGGINYNAASSLNMGSNTSLTPTPQSTTTRMPRPSLPAPTCSGSAINSQSGGTISPGNYSRIKMTNGDPPLNMNPGTYCLTGDFDIQGGEVYGNGVTIYLANGAGVTINGGAQVQLAAPGSGTYGGIVFFMADGNSSVVKLDGNGSSRFIGIVFAPDGEIEIGGTAAVNPTYTTQLVGKYVKVHGNAEIDINYTTQPSQVKKPVLDLLH